MDRSEVHRVAREAGREGGKQAVHETFRLLGIDTKDQRSVNQLRSDMIHLRKLRRTWEGATGKITVAIVTAFFVMVIVAASDWVKALLGIRG